MNKILEKIKGFILINKTELIIIFLFTIFVMAMYALSEAYTNFKLTRSFQFELLQIIKVFALGALTISSSIWYLIKNEKSRASVVGQNPPKLPHVITFIKVVSVSIIASVAFSIYLVNHPSAFGLPPIDMGPFLERQVDPNFAPNDFFTNASMLPSPRHVFGYTVVGLTKLFHTDWYTVFYALFVFFVLIIPALFFLNIVTALRKRIKNDERYLFSLLLTVILTISAFSSKVVAAVSIGWWSPYYLGPSAQTASIFFGLLFSFMALRTKTLRPYVFVPLLLISTLMHPAIGLFTFIFFLLLDFNIQRTRFYLISFITGIGTAYLFIISFFSAKTTLSAIEFIHYYILEKHREHYLISDLATFTNIPWYIIFGMNLVIFGALIIIGTLVRDKYLQKIGSVFFIIYGGAILIQYFFVEIVPIKIIAIISPVRFSIFSFWLLIFIVAYALSQYIPLKLIPFIREHKTFSRKTTIFVVLVLISLLFIAGLQNKDNPKQDFTNQHPGLVQWIESHTTSEEIFAVYPSFPPSHVPLLLNRGVFTGSGFPFTEDKFVENNQRERLLFGSESLKTNTSILLPGGKHDLFYHNLTPNDFVNASKQFQLDYIIIESPYSDKFSKYKPVFENDNLKVYKLLDLTI